MIAPAITHCFTRLFFPHPQHGWQYLGGQPRGRYLWMVIVLASLGVASVFIVTAISDFVDKVVVTTIDTTTASLQVRHLTKSSKRIKNPRISVVVKVR